VFGVFVYGVERAVETHAQILLLWDDCRGVCRAQLVGFDK
jgi:hypothetical protein